MRFDEWVLALTWQDNCDTLTERTTRFVKRAPLGMHLTSDGGFRMIGGAS